MAAAAAQTIYDLGFPLGFKGSADIPGTKDGITYLNNHLLLTIKYHKDSSFDGSRIVGFEVEPSSVKHGYSGAWKGAETTLTTCGGTGGVVPLAMADGGEVVFTYDVKWESSDIEWASRWDTYLLMGDEQIHWFSIVNSLMIVLFLTGMVAMIMVSPRHSLTRPDHGNAGREVCGRECEHCGEISPSAPRVSAVTDAHAAP